jgi:hypothetical protein
MTRLAGMALVLALGHVACGGKEPGHECEALTARLCAGKDPATCQRVEAWLAGAMRGPDGAQLEPGDADQGCKMILEDRTLLDAYTRKTTADLPGLDDLAGAE